MCLSIEAFALFLNILGADLTTRESAIVTVHATDGDVIWRRVEDMWCTEAPHAEGRLLTLPAAGVQPVAFL
ncbi:MAG: hypothetical protein RIG84_10040 [Roseovarius sp.]